MWDVKEPTCALFGKSRAWSFPVLWLSFVCCSFWVGASHRDNFMHLSLLDRNAQEKWLCYMLCYMCSEAAQSINLKMFWQVIPHVNVPYPEGKFTDVCLSVWCPNFVTLSRPGMTFRKHSVIMEINFRTSVNIINLNNWTMLIKSH